jgi:hypothetical protein
MRLEQTHQIVGGRHRLAAQHAALGLGTHLLDQRL